MPLEWGDGVLQTLHTTARVCEPDSAIESPANEALDWREPQWIHACVIEAGRVGKKTGVAHVYGGAPGPCSLSSCIRASGCLDDRLSQRF